MGLRKFTKAEGQAEVLSVQAHQEIDETLRKEGKKSILELSDGQRINLLDDEDPVLNSGRGK